MKRCFINYATAWGYRCYKKDKTQMSLYHLNVKFISRSYGGSVPATMAYIMGTRVKCERTGRIFDYSKKANVASKFCMAPDGFSEHLKDPEKFANYVEAFEDERIDIRYPGNAKNEEKDRKSKARNRQQKECTQTGQSIILALQHELSLEENELALKEFIHETYEKKGFIVWGAIHAEENNLHAHLIVSRRTWVNQEVELGLEKSGAESGSFNVLKDRDIASHAGLREVRQKWAYAVNKAFERNNINKRVTEKSFKDLKLDLDPTIKMGWNATDIERREKSSELGNKNKKARRENIKKIMNNPDVLLKKIAIEKDHFSIDDVQASIAEFFDYDEALMSEYYAVVSKSLVQSVRDIFIEMTPEQKSTYLQENLRRKLVLHDRIECVESESGEVCYRLKDRSEENIKNLNVTQVTSGFIGDTAIFSEDEFFWMVNHKLTKEPEKADAILEQLHLEAIEDCFLEEDRKILESGETLELKARLIAQNLFQRNILEGNFKKIGENASEKDMFAKQSYIEMEKNIFKLLENRKEAPETKRLKDIFKLSGHRMRLCEKVLYEHAQKAEFQLTEEQKNAVRHVSGAVSKASSKNVFVLEGKAGTGKTTIMKLVADTYERDGYKVIGATSQGAAASQLRIDMGRSSCTLHKLFADWAKIEAFEAGHGYVDFENKKRRITDKEYEAAKERSQLTRSHVLVIDEANMVTAGQMEKVLKKVYEVNAKLICIGDDNQIKGHVVSDIFRGFKETVGFVSLTNIIRQKVDWMAKATFQLSNHDHVEPLKAYQDHGHISWLKNEKAAMERMAADFVKDLINKVDARMLAYTKREVRDLNRMTRSLLVNNGHLEEGGEFKVKLECLDTEKIIKTKIKLSVGDRIIIERNENSGLAAKTLKNAKKGINGVNTGDVGDIISVKRKQNKITVRLFDHKDIQKRRIVEIDLNEFNYINYGYAMTTDRSEGKTWVTSYILTSIGMSLNRLYVALSRHTHNIKMYMNLEKSKDLKQYIDKVGKVEKKHLVRDFTRNDKEVYKNRVREYQNLATECSQLRSEIDKLSSENIRKGKGIGNFTEHPAYNYFLELSEEKQKIAKEIVQDWDNHKVFAQTEKLRYDWLLIESGEAPKVRPDDNRHKEFFKLYRDIVYATTDVSANKSVEQFDAFVKTRQLMAAKIASEMAEYNKFTSIFRKNGVLVDCFFDKITKFPVSQDLIMNDAHNFERAATLEEKAHVLNMEISAFGIQGIRNSLISAFPDAQLKAERKETKLSLDVIPENRLGDVEIPQSQVTPALKPKSVTEKLMEGVSETKIDILAEENKMQHTDYNKENDFNSKQRESFKSYDIDLVKERLEDRIEDLARHVFSSEKYIKRHGNEIRIGQKGGISVHISGPKKGGWVNYKTGESGKAFDLLTKEMGMDFKNALDYAASFAGILPEQRKIPLEKMQERLQEKQLKHAQETASLEREVLKKVEKVRAVYKETTPIKGTLAETYLNKRGIESKTFSDNLRFHPNYYSSETKKNYPALVSFARNSKGELRALQAVYLNENGEKNKDLETKKRSFGPLTGSFVTIQAGERNAPIFVAEGVETALSVKEAGVNGTIVAALGIANIKNLECRNQDVVICKDNDGAESQSNKVIEKAQEALKESAEKITIIQPSRIGEDFNDVLSRDGKEFVQTLFKDFLYERKDWRREQSKEHQDASILERHSEKPQATRDHLGLTASERKFLSSFAKSEEELAKHVPLLRQFQSKNKQKDNSKEPIINKGNGPDIDF